MILQHFLIFLAGERIPVNTGTFSNDMTTFYSEDDVLTLLIHLGYLGYNEDTEMAFVPNEEIRQELITAVKSSNYDKESKKHQCLIEKYDKN